ncbi:hypothetical protein TeGR_g921 [Tetraparma gracilis]|uniref:RNA helicase n=1 Tax=Tetraparma gracilis TaxID=2962635 RepID=A0ABQ6MXR1_9STRA|nr:hypothetical protein TeGR_g921 [Tetraparma gracilis]
MVRRNRAQERSVREAAIRQVQQQHHHQQQQLQLQQHHHHPQLQQHQHQQQQQQLAGPHTAGPYAPPPSSHPWAALSWAVPPAIAFSQHNPSLLPPSHAVYPQLARLRRLSLRACNAGLGAACSAPHDELPLLKLRALREPEPCGEPGCRNCGGRAPPPPPPPLGYEDFPAPAVAPLGTIGVEACWEVATNPGHRALVQSGVMSAMGPELSLENARGGRIEAAPSRESLSPLPPPEHGGVLLSAGPPAQAGARKPAAGIAPPPLAVTYVLLRWSGSPAAASQRCQLRLPFKFTHLVSDAPSLTYLLNAPSLRETKTVHYSRHLAFSYSPPPSPLPGGALKTRAFTPETKQSQWAHAKPRPGRAPPGPAALSCASPDAAGSGAAFPAGPFFSPRVQMGLFDFSHWCMFRFLKRGRLAAFSGLPCPPDLGQVFGTTRDEPYLARDVNSFTLLFQQVIISNTAAADLDSAPRNPLLQAPRSRNLREKPVVDFALACKGSFYLTGFPTPASSMMVSSALSSVDFNKVINRCNQAGNDWDAIATTASGTVAPASPLPSAPRREKASSLPSAPHHEKAASEPALTRVSTVSTGSTGSVTSEGSELDGQYRYACPSCLAPFKSWKDLDAHCISTGHPRQLWSGKESARSAEEKRKELIAVAMSSQAEDDPARLPASALSSWSSAPSVSRGGSFTEHRIQQAALSYALRLIYLTALEEFALFKEMESFSLYSKPLLTSFSPGFFAIKNERVMSIRRLDPTASLGEHDPAVTRAIDLFREVLEAPVRPATDPTVIIVDLHVKGVGDNRPLISQFDPVILRVEDPDHPGYSNEICAQVHQVTLKTEIVSLKLPVLNSKVIPGGTMLTLDSRETPHFHFLAALFGLEYASNDGLQPSANPGNAGFDLKLNMTALKESTKTLFDVRLGFGSGKGVRMSRANLIASLPEALRYKVIETTCGNNMLEYRIREDQGGELSNPGVYIGESGGVVDDPVFSRDWRLGAEDVGEEEEATTEEGQEKIEKLVRILAPTQHNTRVNKLPRPQVGTMPHVYNESINGEQRQAIFDITSGFAGNAPYLIWGPPGTGKTTTIVEAILQKVHKPSTHPKRLLVCAPSDAASDVIALRLAEVLQPSQLARVSHFQRKADSLPSALMPYSPVTEDRIFSVPDDLTPFQVVVCTTYVSGMLTAVEFTDCFIDEACQATEPEVLIPLLLLPASASVTLAGDPRQLGPMVCSKAAAEGGLALSLLERLMSLSLYQGGEFAVMTCLRNNYRSHAALLEIPSTLFYKGQLRSCASEEKQLFAVKYEGVRNPALPIIFVDCEAGQHFADVDSPSFLNRVEAEAVVDQCVRLCSSAEVKVAQVDIAVITPFRAQVLLIRQLLRQKKLGNVGVGQVEDYQGQESKVVISSVLTEDEDRWQGEQNRRPFGFFRDAKRFNVAMSRAEALVVIVGRKQYLNSTDGYWQALLEHCEQNGLMEGWGEAKGGGAEGEVGFEGMRRAVSSLGLGFAAEEDHLKRTLGYAGDSAFTWRVTL